MTTIKRELEKQRDRLSAASDKCQDKVDALLVQAQALQEKVFLLRALSEDYDRLASKEGKDEDDWDDIPF